MTDEQTTDAGQGETHGIETPDWIKQLAIELARMEGPDRGWGIYADLIRAYAPMGWGESAEVKRLEAENRALRDTLQFGEAAVWEFWNTIQRVAEVLGVKADADLPTLVLEEKEAAEIHANLNRRICIALHGSEWKDEHTMHDWSTLPEQVSRLRTELAAAKEAAQRELLADLKSLAVSIGWYETGAWLRDQQRRLFAAANERLCCIHCGQPKGIAGGDFDGREWRDAREEAERLRTELAAAKETARQAFVDAFQVPVDENCDPIQLLAMTFVSTVQRNRELLEAARWVPVTERLPLEYQALLVVCGEYVFTGSYAGPEGWVLDGWASGDDPEPTHWQPLPPPPAAADERAEG